MAHDGEQLFLVRQPREAVGEQALLELPAGKLDEEGEEPLETAKRELAEEIGKGARELGAPDELLHLARLHRRGDATSTSPPTSTTSSAEADEDERIEIVERAARPTSTT